MGVAPVHHSEIRAPAETTTDATRTMASRAALFNDWIQHLAGWVIQRRQRRQQRQNPQLVAHVPVGDIASRLHMDPAMRQLLVQRLGQPTPLVLMATAAPLNGGYVQALILMLPAMVYIFQHPLNGTEARAAVYAQAFLFPVLVTLNYSPEFGDYRVEHDFTIPNINIDVNINNVGLRRFIIGGRCEFLITRNCLPYCIVELKRHATNEAIFAQATHQVFVYAAAVGHATHQPTMRAIVTNLRRWQFLQVNGANYALSTPYDLVYANNGIPNEDSLRGLIDLLLALLIPPKWWSLYLN